MQQPEYKSDFSLHLIPREGATRLGSAWLLADDLAQKRLVHLAPHCPPVSRGEEVSAAAMLRLDRPGDACLGRAPVNARAFSKSTTRRPKEAPMITAIVLYDLPPNIGLEECRAHFTKIAPDFLKVPGFLRKQFICARDGKVAGGVYMWESQEVAERFYSGEWLAGIQARYGTEPKISYFETVALTDKASGQAGGLD
jgi:Putative mono-oxygenase ydhR